MKKSILLVLILGFSLSSCTYKPPPPPSCAGNWTSLNPNYTYTPTKSKEPCEINEIKTGK